MSSLVSGVDWRSEARRVKAKALPSGCEFEVEQEIRQHFVTNCIASGISRVQYVASRRTQNMKASLCLFARSPHPQPSHYSNATPRQPIAPLPPFQIMIDTLQSPLTNVSVNGKRRFACSPIQDASTTSSIHLTTNNSLATAISDDHHDANMMMMDDSHSYGFQSAKRRRKLSNDGLFGGGGMVGDSVMMKENNGWGVSPFVHSGVANGELV